MILSFYWITNKNKVLQIKELYNSLSLPKLLISSRMHIYYIDLLFVMMYHRQYLVADNIYSWNLIPTFEITLWIILP